MKVLPLVRLPRNTYQSLETMTKDCLTGCRHLANDGTPIYFPDGSGHYAALWTRDFCYMVEGAGRLLPPQEILAGIDFLLAGQREDGVIPDRVEADGTPVYQAGPVDQPLGYGPPVDNAPFMAKLLCAYLQLTKDFAGFNKRLACIFRALASVPLEHDGLVVIDRNLPQPGYGFTDCIAKSGKVLFSSLLYWEACVSLAQTFRQWEQHDDAHDWFERAEKTIHRLQEFWDDGVGMYRAASQDCRQIDLWGSAYAAVIRVASKTQSDRIASYLLSHRREITRDGYVRHLPAGEYWQRTFIPVEKDTYQNGGYWAVPAGWVARTIALVDERAGREQMAALIARFATEGICEWVSDERSALPGYGASAACLLGSALRSKA